MTIRLLRSPYYWYFRLIIDTHNFKYRKSTALCLLNRFWRLGCTVRRHTPSMCHCPQGGEGGGCLFYKPYSYVQPLEGRVFAPYWSENGYRLCTLWCGIGCGFRGNYESVWMYLSFQFQMNEKERYAIISSMRIPKWILIKKSFCWRLRSENGCGRGHFVVWNRVTIWKTSWHTPTKISQEYPPGNCHRGYTRLEPLTACRRWKVSPEKTFAKRPTRKTSGMWVLGLMFTRYVLLAFQSRYPILVYFVANYRPHLSHFLENVIFVIPIGHFLFIHLPCQSFKKVIQNLSSMDDNNPVEK